MRTFLTLIVTCAALVAVASPASPAEIRGAIQLVGCDATPTELRVVAQESAITGALQRPQAGRPGAVSPARITRTGPSVFQFVIPGVDATRTYALGAHYLGSSCGKLVWRAPTGRDVLGGSSATLLKGYAVRTQVEVMSEPVGKRPARWVGAARMDVFDAASALRSVRIRTDDPTVVAVDLQVSTSKFITDDRGFAAACSLDQNQPGLAVTKRIAISKTGWSDAGPVDFKTLLQPSGPPTGDYFVGGLKPETVRLIRAGAPLYVRVIPMADDGSGGLVRLCDPVRNGIPGWVIVGNGGMAHPSKPFTPLFGEIVDHVYSATYTPPVVDPGGHPLEGEICYQAVQDHQIPWWPYDFFNPDIPYWAWDLDRWGAKMVKYNVTNPDTGFPFKPTDTVHRGFVFCESTSDPFILSLFESIGDFVTGFIDVIGWAVTQAAVVFEEIKKAVGDAMVFVLQAIPVVCQGDNQKVCEDLVEGAIDTGLVAMGIPPSLPNWDELKSKGINYLAAEIADQAGVSSIPGAEVIVANALAYAEKAFTELDNHRSDGLTIQPAADWLAYYQGFKPGILDVTVSQEGVLDLSGVRWALKANDNDVFFGGGYVPLPHSLPWSGGGQQLSVPLVLRPNTTVVPDCPGSTLNGVHIDCKPYEAYVWFKARWLDRLNANPCVTFDMRLLVYPFGGTPDSLFSFDKENRSATGQVWSWTDYITPLPPSWTSPGCVKQPPK